MNVVELVNYADCFAVVRRRCIGSNDVVVVFEAASGDVAGVSVHIREDVADILDDEKLREELRTASGGAMVVVICKDGSTHVTRSVLAWCNCGYGQRWFA